MDINIDRNSRLTKMFILHLYLIDNPNSNHSDEVMMHRYMNDDQFNLKVKSLVKKVNEIFKGQVCRKD